MADNKTGVDKIHKRMPAVYKTRENPNWSAVIKALGEADTDLLNLIQEVRKQFTVSTASRPYIDRLGANVKVSRPKFVGMDDPTFRQFVPVVAYQPKQVKLVMDLLLDLFFFKEATTAFTQSTISQPFTLKDGWRLEYTVDSQEEERITFNADDFVDINNITADEVVAAINRQAEYSFAIVFDDRIVRRQFIRLFSNTVGSKGSIEITGGLANLGFQFTGFIDNAGSGSNTQWNIVKVGDTITFTHTGGVTPNLQNIQAGNVALIDIPGNEGTFVVEEVDIGNSSFTFTNLFGTTMVYDHSVDPTSAVEFMSQEKIVVFKNDTRAVVWEVSPGEIIVEMPASPPVVKRSLRGSAHINGLVTNISNVPDSSSLDLEDGSLWPEMGGKFVIQEVKEIQTHIETDTEDVVLTKQFGTRYDRAKEYTYTGKTGDTLTGITPSLPTVAQLFESTISTAARDSSNEVLVTTSSAHGFSVGENVGIINSASTVVTQGVTVDILSTDTATQIAMKTAAILNTIPFFTVGSVGPVVTVTDNNLIDVIDAADVNTGATVTVVQQGISGVLPEITDIDFSTTSAAALDVVGVGNYFNLNTDGNDVRYHVWYRVTDGNNQIDPAVTPSVNGSHIITSVPTSTTFTYDQIGTEGTSFGGTAKVERYGMSNTGSLAILSSAKTSTGVIGPYMWDSNATFVLSSLTSNIQQKIFAGTSIKQLTIDTPNNIPSEEGFVIFDFGTEEQEGPVRYLFKPTDGSMQIDPAYVFEYNHETGSSVTVIRRRGAHVMSGLGLEYPSYITDPSVARETLKDLLLEVKSVGIFIEFLIRYPEQLYATLDVYKSCRDGLYPVDEDAAAACEI
jgi:hypothetical protein